MAYWLMKSEPDVFSIHDLQAMSPRAEPWDGVRNYQARNMLRDQMQQGDQAFFYHSNCKVPGIVGTMTVVKNGYPDPSAMDPNSDYFDPKSSEENPRWYQVNVQFSSLFAEVVSLKTLKADPALSELPLVQKGSRLSLMPVTEAQWRHILQLATPAR